MVIATLTSVLEQLDKEFGLLLDTQDSSAADIADDGTVKKGKILLWLGVGYGCQLYTAILQLIKKCPGSGVLLYGRSSSSFSQFRQKKTDSLQESNTNAQNKRYTYECAVYNLLRYLRIAFDYIQADDIKSSGLVRRDAELIHRGVGQMSLRQ